MPEILRDIYPKNIFPVFFWGGGGATALLPAPRLPRLLRLIITISSIARIFSGEHVHSVSQKIPLMFSEIFTPLPKPINMNLSLKFGFSGVIDFLSTAAG